MKVTIYDQRDVEPYKKMRFILPSLSEVRTLAQGLYKTIDGNNKIMVPLGHGYLTWPLNCINKGAVTGYYDVFKGPGCKYWNNQSIPGYSCWNEHGGVDIAGSLGWVIVASAPGTVRTGHNNIGALWVDVTVKNTSWIVSYGHVEEYLVSTGELVQRGQPIALLGDTGGTFPHIHFAIFSGGEEAFDPYRNLFDNYSRSLWTVDNEPQCLPTE